MMSAVDHSTPNGLLLCTGSCTWLVSVLLMCTKYCTFLGLDVSDLSMRVQPLPAQKL